MASPKQAPIGSGKDGRTSAVASNFWVAHVRASAEASGRGAAGIHVLREVFVLTSHVRV